MYGVEVETGSQEEMGMVLETFHPAVRAWFEERFGKPSPPQEEGWPVIGRGENALILAPTGSGKTLAAFLKCLDTLYQEGDSLSPGVQVLYISPLKALNNDIYRNLEVPLQGIAAKAAEMGITLPVITSGIRTGDTPQRQRAAMVKHPPHVLITTPESLYLLLTSNARRILQTVRYMIVDEIHAISGTKRGVHLSLSLERLEALLPTAPVRIGLSATQRPLEEIARYLGGVDRPVRIIDTGSRKQLDLMVEVPMADMRFLPEGSTWPPIYQRILERVSEHKSTLVFVNSRGLAERLTDRLNDLAGRETAKVHHGSVSRERREMVEADLKAGRLPCLVATSSLELGIDVGAVDLVIQIESPKSVARGLQRVGRAGHVIGAASKGRLIPKFRGDLLETACIVREMKRGRVEETHVPTNALDVLAQQIVAMTAMDEWRVDELLALLRRSYCYRDLSERQLNTVLEMLSGRYPSDEFREFRPRIVWDREVGTIRGREGSRSLAVLSGGTIPDRGYYGVYLAGTDVKLGEMDEEFVYESRVGEVFLLGTNTWRIQSIEHDRITVSDALGAQPKMPFWKGDGLGRPYEMGVNLGRFTREVAERLSDPALPAWLEAECNLDRSAATNLIQYLKDQVDAAGAIPTDRQVVVERYQDEAGDARLVILSPFGGRVNLAWSIVLKRRIRQFVGIDAEVTTNDDVIHFRLPGADRPVDLAQLLRIDPDEAMELLLEEVGNTPLFGAYFRMSAGRALVLPRPRPGRRRPFWLQRMKAADLLEVARRYEEFPIVLETYREVLRDVLDMEGLRQVLTSLQDGSLAVEAVQTDGPSPMAATILLQFVADNMYMGETPRAERRGAMLSLNRDLLREILGAEQLRELLDPRAIALVEERLQRRAEAWRPRHADETEDLLRQLGDLTEAELKERGVDPAWLEQLARERRAALVRVHGEERWISLDDRGLYADPGGNAGAVIRRFARNRGPFQPEAVTGRYGLDSETVHRYLSVLQAEGLIVAGEYTQGVTGREYCDLEVLQQIHRQTLSLLRQEVEPVTPEVYARFLLQWQEVGAGRQPRPTGRQAGPPQALERVIAQLQGLQLPAELWEREILPSRVPGYQPPWLDQLCAAGELHWAAGPGSRVALHLPGDLPAFASRFGGDPPAGLTPERERVLHALGQAGADFLGGIARAAGLPPAATLEVLWDLAWLGLVTNDTFDPLRQALRVSKAAAKRGSPLGLRGGTGRWWLTSRLGGDLPGPAAVESYARLLLGRYGVVTREMADADDSPFPWGEVLQTLKRMEWKGQVRQGYFVAGLTGSQFARPEVVDRLRRARDESGTADAPTLLPSLDPANPYGSIFPWPEGARLTRLPSTYLIMANGLPVLGVEAFGKRLTPLAPLEGERLRAALATLPALLRAPAPFRPVRRIEVEQWGDQPVLQSPVADLLCEIGFERAPRKLVYYP